MSQQDFIEKDLHFQQELDKSVASTVEIATALVEEITHQGEQINQVEKTSELASQTIKESQKIVRSMDSYSYWFWLWLKRKLQSLASYVYHNPLEITPPENNADLLIATTSPTNQVDSNQLESLDQIEQLKQLSLIIGDTLDQQNHSLDSLQDNSEQNEARLTSVNRRANKMS